MSGKTRTQRLRAKSFYHGMIQRPDVEELLRRPGDYLLRKTDNTANQTRLALSVYWTDQVRHFIVQEAGNDVFFEESGHHEQDVEALVRWYERRNRPITQQSGVRLRRAVPREEWILTHESIKLGKKIGAGQFGEVFSAQFKLAPGTNIEVAVKTLRDGEAIDNQKNFLAEARVMRRLQHPNVVRTYGVAVYERPLLIVMELCAGGSLLTHLRTNQTTPDQKLRWVTEAAKGLEYIASQGLLHRDIAARNCLLTAKELTLKIADFGLTLKAKTISLDNLGKVPVKWLAKETLELGVYSPQTDVWSYGIMCWEIYADGQEPYPGMSNQQTRNRIILYGHRNEIPEGTPPRVAELINQCWENIPRERPSFREIVRRLTSATG